jgi:GNAT superfamily N-acetyltransferase
MTYRIRKARVGEGLLLTEIETLAYARYRAYPGFSAIPEPLPDAHRYDAIVEDDSALVAVDDGDSPIGFALLFGIDDEPYLGELNVLPAHQERGVGTSLLEAACQHAHERGGTSLLLRTFRDVPWNAPFYRKRGFRTLSPGDIDRPGMHDQIRAEAEGGIDVSRRVFMRKML